MINDIEAIRQDYRDYAEKWGFYYRHISEHYHEWIDGTLKLERPTFRPRKIIQSPGAFTEY